MVHELKTCFGRWLFGFDCRRHRTASRRRVLVSVLFWGGMWGVWGLVLAAPITVSIKAAADHIDGLRPVGEILGR